MTSRPAKGQPRDVLILNLDTFEKKNLTQIRELEKDGWTFHVVTNDQRGNSRPVFDRENFLRSRLHVAGQGLIARVRLFFRLVRTTNIHHVEIYAAGRMTTLYLLLLKLLRRKVIVFERGDVGCLTDYSWDLRTTLKLAYRQADGVIYKETYMKELLRSFSKAPSFFVPNSVAPAADAGLPFAERDIDFLWVNRMTPQRRPEWFLRALGDSRLAAASAAMLGFDDRDNLPEHLRVRQQEMRRLARAGMPMLGFTDPEPFYRRAKFFCLPSELIFGNNSLLEAMAHGVVPIVSQAPGIEQMVRDGVSGIVTPFDEAAFRDAMVRAAGLGADEWERLSRAARATAETEYSPDVWRRRMAAAYESIGRL